MCKSRRKKRTRKGSWNGTGEAAKKEELYS